MYVCMLYAYLYACICLSIFIYRYVYYVYKYACKYICIYASVYIDSVSVYMYQCLNIYLASFVKVTTCCSTLERLKSSDNIKLVCNGLHYHATYRNNPTGQVFRPQPPLLCLRVSGERQLFPGKTKKFYLYPQYPNSLRHELIGLSASFREPLKTIPFNDGFIERL